MKQYHYAVKVVFDGAEFGGRSVVAVEIKAHSAPTPHAARHLVWLRDQLGDRLQSRGRSRVGQLRGSRPQSGGLAGAGVTPAGVGLVQRRGEHGDPARGLIAPGRATGDGRSVADQVGATGAGIGDGDERRRERHARSVATSVLVRNPASSGGAAGGTATSGPAGPTPPRQPDWRRAGGAAARGAAARRTPTRLVLLHGG